MNHSFKMALICLYLLTLVNIHAQEIEDLYNLSLSELSQVKAYTASRSLTNVEKSPSVITVITSEEIKRHGYKNLYDALERVPGFYMAINGSWEMISNRGFVQAHNINYLFLIDGHSQNNIGSIGMGYDHIYFPLNHVKRIEIIRGPGSTLWGSDAAMGIINIITKNATDINSDIQSAGSWQISLDYETDHKRSIAHVSYGKKLLNGGFVFNATKFDSDPDWTSLYTSSDSGLALSNREMSNWDLEGDNYDVSVKYQRGDWRSQVSLAKYNSYNNTHTRTNGREGWRGTEKNWFELDYNPQLSDKTDLQLRLYYDDFSTKVRSDLPSGIRRFDVEEKAQGVGVESIITHNMNDHNLKFGLFFDRKNISQPISILFQTSDPSLGYDMTNVIPAFTDRNKGVFIEDVWTGFEDWQFTFGARLDRNKPRDESTAFMPRISAIKSLGKNYTFKYAYNTGYMRPTASQTRAGVSYRPQRGRFVAGATDSQEIQSHDLQLLYSSSSLQYAVTLYSLKIKKVIVLALECCFTINGIEDVELFDTNANELSSAGIEVDIKWQVKDNLQLYGNIAFNHANYDSAIVFFQNTQILNLIDDTNLVTDDLTPTGTPQTIWNLGVDWQIATLNINLHYRGWDNNYSKININPDSYKNWGTKHYLDVNLLWQGIFESNVEVALYVKNILGTDGIFPDGNFGGYNESQRDRMVGVNIGVHF